MGVSRTEKCRKGHEARTSSETGPSFERAFDQLMKEDEEVLRRKHVRGRLRRIGKQERR